jgi:hypothetical protein
LASDLLVGDFVAACGIHSIAITETGPSRSPKPIDGDRRNQSIAIGGPANQGDPLS